MTKFIENNISEFATEYDKYFEGGLKSLYRSRFGNNPVLPREQEIINSLFLNLIYKIRGKYFRILDYGCGDGRLLAVYEYLSIVANKFNKILHITCYDPSQKGLESLEKTLLLKNFKYKEFNDFQNTDQGYIKSILVKNNITLRIIHGNANNTTDYVKNLIGDNYNLVLLMFGVLSHIVGRLNRQATLQMLRESMSTNKSNILVNVPTKKIFKKYLLEYDYLRNTKQENLLGLAKEQGDIYYLRNDNNKIIKNYYHIYSYKELIEDLIISNLLIENKGISSIKHVPVLSKKTILEIKLDSLFSSILSSKYLSFNWTDVFGSYIFAIAKK